MSAGFHGNTKGYQIYIHHVHIADGFADDCEELIQRWLKTETLTYETFCEIWKDMQFNYLYHGRSSGAEIAELSEELIQIAKHYMVSNSDNFEETVAGLFLVYALLRLQPYAGFASLRLVPEDSPALARLEARARRERRYDVLFILGSILIEGPVQYHAANRERGMESSIRKYLEGTTGIDRLGVRPKGVFYRQNEESDLLRELNSITRRYVDAKKAIGGESLGLNYTNENLATELDTSLKEVINGIVDDGPEATQRIQEHYSRVQEIKAKAMKQAVEGVKHLASVSEKGANKVAASPKPQTAVAPLPPPRAPRRPAPRGRPRKRPRPPSDTDTTDEPSSEGDDTDDDTGRVEIAPNLDLEPIDSELDLIPAEGEQEKEINIEIESLPVFIRTEQGGKTYEIEVIDNLDDRQRDALEEVPQDAQTILKKLPDVSCEKLDAGEGTSGFTESAKESETPETGSETPEASGSTVTVKEGGEEEMPRLKKKEKRDLKKTALKSKFKRMGMLPMIKCKNKNKKSPKGKVKSKKT